MFVVGLQEENSVDTTTYRQNSLTYPTCPGMNGVGFDTPSADRVGQPAYWPRRFPLKQSKLLNVTALPPHVSAPSELRGQWSVAQVRNQHEAALVEFLAMLGLGWFLPFEELRKIDSQGKRREFRRLLFPAYVPFCCEHVEDAWTVNNRDCVCRVIAPPIQSRFIREIGNLHVVLENGFKIDPCPEATVGRRCRVHTGPLRGIEGRLIRRDDKNDIVVLDTQVLGSSGVHVPLDVIEVID